MAIVRTGPMFRKGGNAFQDVYIDGVGLRKEVKEGGRTFTNMAEYLTKYHGYKNFALVAGYGGRVKNEWWIRIRRKGLLERIFSPSLDGTVWDGKE